jgi:thioredoxin-related protein
MPQVRWAAMVSVAVVTLAAPVASAQEWGKPKPAVRNEPTAPARSSIPKAVQTGPKLEWTESFVTASRQARQGDKIILAYFGGSDWCEWTKKLDKEVMTTPMFVNWAERNVIPLKVDYPSPDTRQSRATAKQNEILAASYNVAKTPTILFLDMDGEVIDRVGYDSACLRDDEQKGSPVSAMNRFEEILSKRPTGQQLKEYTFLEAAETTEKTGQFLLVMITNPNNKLGSDTRQRLLQSTKLAKFVNTNMAFVNLTWPADDDTSEQAQWFRTFTEGYKVGPAPIQLLVMTYGGRKIQHKIMVVDQVDGLINQLAQQLPKFDYTGTWLTDYRKAQSISAQSGRDILLSFTSFDSSEWCQKLDAEVYQTDAFKQYAQKNLVLVRVDFPTTTTQPTTLKNQNQALAEGFNIRGYPSLVLLNAKGQKIGTAKYMPGGPDAFIKEMDELRRRDFDRRTVTSEQVEVKKK